VYVQARFASPHRPLPPTQVFDDKNTFAEWFGDSLGKAAGAGAGQEEEWLETEKRVVVIHRLHQILEPFMLRRQVEDVESKLPPKVFILPSSSSLHGQALSVKFPPRGPPPMGMLSVSIG